MFRRKRQHTDFNAEIDAHLALEVERLKEQGMSEDQARAAARRSFGNVTQAQERFYDSSRWMWFEQLSQDIRYGLRQLRRNPGFTTVAILTLALGIGANSAIFNVLDAVLLRSLPVAEPQQLVLLTDPDSHGINYGDESGNRSLLTFAEFERLRDHNDVFSGIFAADSQLPQLQVVVSRASAGESTPEENARVRLVSGGYFSTLGVTAALGRLFTSDVDRARGGFPIAVISFAYWKNRYLLDPAVLGKTIRINQTSFEIIGVTTPGFFGETVGQAPDIWVPMMMQDAIYPGRDLLTARPGLTNQYIWLQAIARLKSGETIRQAEAGINVSFKQLLESSLGPGGTPEQRRSYFDQRIKLTPGARGASTLHETFADPLKLLMAIVVLVLLIACANVANLQLTRGTARRREFAVRMAIGAGRSRLLSQLLVEAFLLAFLGGTAGLFVGEWTDALLVRMVVASSTGGDSMQLNLKPDVQTLVFTLVIAVLTALIFGLAPALRASRFDVSEAMKSGPTGATTEEIHRRLPAGKLLVIGQVAVSLILLVAAGLFVHSLARLSQVNLGYERESLLLFRVDSAPAGYTGGANIRFHQDLLARFSSLPGVRAATLSANGLFEGSDSGDPIAVEGYTSKAGEEPHSRMDHVGPGYFSTLGIPVLIGRGIGPKDFGNGPRAAVINQAFARTYFPSQNPIGKHVRDTFPGNPGEAEIVGVVADAKQNSLRDTDRPRIYFPFFNPVWEHSRASYEVRAFGDPASVSREVCDVVRQTNSALPPVQIETLSGLVDQSLGTDRLIMRLSGAFAVLALLLASIGLYGVMAYTVARRGRDIGLRMALGARPGRILWDVLRETLALVVLGLVLGIPVALAGTRLIKSLLFGLDALDGIVLVSGVLLLAFVALLAGFLPAHRAAHVDPVVALRYE